MTHEEYDELALLWSTASRPHEERELERLARLTPRLARMAQWGELSVVAMLAVAIGLSIVWNLGPATILTGGLILLLLAWSAWKRHHLGNIALLIDESDRASFMRSSLRAKVAELKRSAIGLALVFPGIVLTMLLGFSLREQPGHSDLADFLAAVLSTPRGLVALGFMACAALMLSLSHLRLAGEVGRARALWEEYANEARGEANRGRRSPRI